MVARRPTIACLLVALALTLGLSPRPAQARDEFVNRVNEPLSKIPKSKRSDLILLPTLVDLVSPPAEVAKVGQAVLMLPTSDAWPTVEAWAKAAPQQAVLKALADITKEEDYHVAMVFAQGYGVEAALETTDLIAAGMYTELGDPPMLANAVFGYLPKMRETEILANVEATRLVAAGDSVGALDTLFHLMYFGRQMADRPMLPEKSFGMNVIGRALERIRDVVYQDMRSPQRRLDYKALRGYVERLEENTGYLGINRIPLPTGTFLAADQVLNRVLEYKKGVNEATFAVVLARVASHDRPLRLFSEMAYWDTARPQHEGWYASRDMLVGRDENGGLVYDWTKRWNLSPHDSLVKSPSDYKRHVARGPRFAALRAVLSGVETLFPMRLALRAEVAGTRMALAIYGYTRQQNETFPPLLSSIRPAFVSAIDNDPYSTSRQPLGYFVPIRDRIPKQDPRMDPIPLMVHIYPTRSYKSFVIPLRDDTFVLYSVGPDDASVLAKDVTQEDPELEGDYLLWPPVISLIRQSMIDAGELK